jgi:hypothetical protein
MVAKDDATIVAQPHRPRRRMERQDVPPLETSMSGRTAALPNKLRQNTMAQRSTGASRAKKPAVLKASAERINRSWPFAVR